MSSYCLRCLPQEIQVLYTDRRAGVHFGPLHLEISQRLASHLWRSLLRSKDISLPTGVSTNLLQGVKIFCYPQGSELTFYMFRFKNLRYVISIRSMVIERQLYLCQALDLRWYLGHWSCFSSRFKYVCNLGTKPCIPAGHVHTYEERKTDV